MVQVPIKANINTLAVPTTLLIQVTLEQFAQLAGSNLEMREVDIRENINRNCFG